MDRKKENKTMIYPLVMLPLIGIMIAYFFSAAVVAQASTPLVMTPATGDSAPVVLWVVLMALSLIAILLIVFFPKRNRKGKYSK